MATVASVAVLGVGWQLGVQAVDAGQNLASATAASAAVPAAATPSTPTQPAPAPAVAVSATSTGTAVQTRFGPVQVAVTISNGTITEVTALQLTNHDGRSVMISNRAAPVLRSEVLQAQAASVQNVSGATYTSMGYAQSLQSALDAAGF